MPEKKRLVNQEKLLNSGVVANNRMNRGRGCLGKNSHQQDLSFNPIEFLKDRFRCNQYVSWLDICCGEGRALIESAAYFARTDDFENFSNRLQIIGIDLAGKFRGDFSESEYLRLLELPVEDFEPSQEFDLITCVHGLHYIGDKLSVVQNSARWLKEDGMFLANLQLKSLKLVESPNSKRVFSDFLRKQGFTVGNRKHLLALKGRRNFTSPFEYLGADTEAGPNFTGQPAVDSYYKF